MRHGQFPIAKKGQVVPQKHPQIVKNDRLGVFLQAQRGDQPELASWVIGCIVLFGCLSQFR
jgi:hypothetical protein